MRTAILGALLAALMLGSGAAAATDPAVVTLPQGQLKGSVQAGVLAFKGVPFAAPPTGALRWRAPQPGPKWTGVRAADAYGPDCAQNPFPGDAAPLGVPWAEDCLYLNVWRPAPPSTAKLPVMVWIYGGGYVNGGSSPAVYDGSQLARQGVVLVSFNYRVGRFGFFAHPALTKAAGDEPVGNYGVMDQIAALRWVKANIARFGGDPDNVTVFGESAGGGSVLMLLTSPASRGLFHKAIVESGGGRGGLTGLRKLSEDQPGWASAESFGLAFGKSVGVEGSDAAALAALRALPAERVIAGMNMMSSTNPTYSGGPMIDGKVVADAPDAIIAAAGQAKVPLLIGANDADLGFPAAADKPALFATFGDKAEAARAAYDPDGSGAFRAVAVKVASDRMMVEPARYLARLWAGQGLPVYHYRFSYVAQSIRDKAPGATHASEIPFVFDTVKARYGDTLTAQDEAAAQAAMGAWVAFAKTGDPGVVGGARWPRYDAGADVLLNFTNDGPRAMADPWKARLDLVAGSVKAGP